MCFHTNRVLGGQLSLCYVILTVLLINYGKENIDISNYGYSFPYSQPKILPFRNLTAFT